MVSMRCATLLAICFLAACGDSHAAVDANGDGRGNDTGLGDSAADGNSLTPDTLAGTGLCLDAACTQISGDVYAYTPQFPLWADTASKKRWMYLPPGSHIDTADMDHWVFPIGTKFWKEFTRDGIRVETRYNAKVGPGNDIADWFYVSYAWNASQDATTAVTLGQLNANGTQHDIPPRSACRGCHENLQPTRILGFGAIQLDTAAATGEIALPQVIANGWLTAAPAGSTTPYFPLPTDGTTGAQAAMGYLHANCGHCHNPTSGVYLNNGIQMVLRLSVGALGTVAATPVYMTAVNHNANIPIDNLTKIIVSAMPASSIMIDRFESTNTTVHMPALGSEMTDPTGDTTLRTWITNLP